MKFLVLALCIAAVTALDIDPEFKEAWNTFKRTYGKIYDSNDEELSRFSIWKSNLGFITQHNTEADAGKHTFRVTMNKFGDLTATEFAKIYNGFNVTAHNLVPESKRTYFVPDPLAALPDSVDWRTQGYVTDIKDQGQCGSCWAFSSTGSLEGQHFKATGKLVSLSEQNLVDCSTAQGNQGCDGGLMDQAFKYIQVNNGIDTEDSYPYEAVDQDCQFDPKNVGATDNGFTDIKSKDESALQAAVANVGPISVAIDASHASFQFYSSGVYYERLCSETRLDHGVLAVGYGTENSKDYWIVKNSWGTSWGTQGYILMSRNKKNNCGISTAASYPNV